MVLLQEIQLVFTEKDLNNSNFVLFLLNKMLYFRSQVKKFQNYIYFIGNWFFLLFVESTRVVGLIFTRIDQSFV
jgi:hypothetical protein